MLSRVRQAGRRAGRQWCRGGVTRRGRRKRRRVCCFTKQDGWIHFSNYAGRQALWWTLVPTRCHWHGIRAAGQLGRPAVGSSVLGLVERGSSGWRGNAALEWIGGEAPGSFAEGIYRRLIENVPKIKWSPSLQGKTYTSDEYCMDSRSLLSHMQV